MKLYCEEVDVHHRNFRLVVDATATLPRCWDRIEAVVAGEGPLYVTEALEGQGLAYCAETMAFDIPEAIWSRAEVGTRYQWEVINVSEGRRCAHGSVEKF